MKSVKYIIVSISVLVLFSACNLSASDWPTYQHDYYRSGVSDETLEFPLRADWVHSTTSEPLPAWSEYPFLQDFWQGLYNNKPRVPIERAFRVVISSDKVYYGSSASDKLVCLDAATGHKVWQFITEGPVRFCPSVSGDKIYFGSDDGYVYCLNRLDGSLIWKNRAAGTDDLIMADGRLVSICPVRSGVAIDNGVAYWSVGLFAGAKTGLQRYIIACNALTGDTLWKKTPSKPVQGYPLLSSQRIYLPCGKSTPIVHNRSDGGYLGTFNVGRQGGSYALLTSDNKFFFGPHYASNGSYIERYNADTRARESIGWGPGNYLVVSGNYSYYSSDTKISKIERSSKNIQWSVDSEYPYEMILAGPRLFAGGDGKVAAFDTQTGKVVWNARVTGRVGGLAVSGGALYVSTDAGKVYCFRNWKSHVDLTDFADLAFNWLNGGCGSENFFCGSSDLDLDGQVDTDDLMLLIDNWLN